MDPFEERDRLLNEPLTNKPILTEEPASLRDKKHVSEYLSDMTCHIFSSSVKFRSDELRRLQEMGDLASIQFDSQNQSHVAELKKLANIVFPEKQLENVLDDPEWKKLGFQNSKPESDFRGGGFLSLIALQNFCKNRRQVVTEILNWSESQPPFLFACVVISAAFKLKHFFHFGLLEHYIKKHDEPHTCSRDALKVFLCLMGSLQDQFLTLVEHYTLKTFEYWKSETQKNPQLTIIDFKTCEERIDHLFKKQFEIAAVSRDKGDIELFLQEWDAFVISERIIPFQSIH